MRRGVRSLGRGPFRRRLTLAFVLVAAGSTAALAAGSFLLVRHHRISGATERALDQSRFNLVLAVHELSPQPSEPGVEELLSLYEERGTFETIIEVGGSAASSVSGLALEDVPGELRQSAPGLIHARLDIAESPYIVVAGRLEGLEARLIFFFPQTRLTSELRELGTVLLGTWGLVFGIALVAGRSLARRTLLPVARAAEASRQVAEGLLDTRLPVGQDEFGNWAVSFNRMVQALQERIASLDRARERERRFTADVAHELRTPLSAMVGAASLLREHLDDLPAQDRRPAELLVTEVARLRRLVEDLMEVARLDSGVESIRREPLELQALVAAVLASREWERRVRLEGDDARVTSDRRRLERIVANLVGNAIEHGGGEATVRIARDGNQARLDVSDRGPGIPPEDLPHLFQRFYQGDTSRSRPGSGLGLAIAGENARLLGTSIEVESEPGRGTTFSLMVGTEATDSPVAESFRNRTRSLHGIQSTGGRPA
jgi:two-component system sensor histidine kinase MtrB